MIITFKEHHLSILHLNIAFLNEHIDSLSNPLSFTKLSFPVIGLSEHKIGPNTETNSISLPGYASCFDEIKL